MNHLVAAHVAAVVGAIGACLVLLPARRRPLAAGLAFLAAAEILLLYALIPSHDLARLTASPLRVGAVVVGVLATAGLGLLLARLPAFVPLVLLLAAPFRVPVTLGQQEAFLLVPLYVVLGAACVSLLVRAVRGPLPPLPRVPAVAAAAYIALDAVSLLWSKDPHAGSIELTFFIFPFAALVAVVARSPFPEWLPRALGAVLVGLASLFAIVGLWQEATHRVFFAHDLAVANSYTSYFRVTSLFKDPSLYGSHLVLAIAVLLVALWARALPVSVIVALLALLGAGLYFTYSQSSFATLFVVTLAVTLATADRTSRLVVGAAVVACVAVAAVVVVAGIHGQSARHVTSGRSRLISETAKVVRRDPLVGVGVGAQPLASQRRDGPRSQTQKNASHTTPLTVAAELGVVGIVAYLGLLAAIVLVLRDAIRRRRVLGLCLAAVFCSLFVQSLSYAGFFENPLLWGTLALGVATARLQPRRVRDEVPVRPEPVALPAVEGVRSTAS